MEGHVAIIPCRKGSKSLKDKNLLTLNNKTLVRIAVEAAVGSGFFRRILLTTDYPKFRLGIDDIYSTMSTKILTTIRPEELCQDDSLMIDVIKHAIKQIDGMYTWIWLLQPTSPFRNDIDFEIIKGAVETGEFESAISFCPSKDNQSRLYTVKDGIAFGSQSCNFKNKEELKQNYTRSGNYYVFKKDKFLEKNEIQIKPYFSYFMGNIDPDKASKEDILYSRMCGVNIDALEDYEIAKNHIRRGSIVV